VRRLVALAVTLAAFVSASSATPAAQLRYFQLSARAIFHQELDYGSGPRAVYNGSYTRNTDWQMRAIVTYDGSRATTLDGAAVAVAGAVTISEHRFQNRTGSGPEPMRCAARGAVPFSANSPDTWWYHTGSGGVKFVAAPGAHMTVSKDGLGVDPGLVMGFSGCAATESLGDHGLPIGPSIRVSAPLRSRFTGTAPFSVTCSRGAEHPFKTSGPNGDGHSFKGKVQAVITLRPFPATQLAAVKQRLRTSFGKHATGTSFPNPRDCFR
jgi:hypothetical protein